MTDVRSSADLRSLIEAAKTDGPSASARAKVWGTLSSAIGAGAAAGAAASSGVGGFSAAKALVAGTLLGGAITVGLAAAALTLRPLPVLEPEQGFGAGAGGARVPSEAIEQTVVRVAALGPEPDVAGSAAVSGTLREDSPPDSLGTYRARSAAKGGASSASSQVGGSRALHEATGTRGSSARVAAAASALGPPPDDDLGREAWLLGDARSALARGDAASALRSVHATMGIPNRQLVPEELALEAQTLRRLGRIEEANALDAHLRSRFPDSALGR